MVTRKHTVTNHLCASNVVDHTIAKNATSVKIHQQNVHCAEAVTQPTIKAVSTTITQLKETTYIDLLRYAHHH